MTNNFPGIGYTTAGYDYNYFKKITVTSSTFGGASISLQQPDIIITFPTQGILILNEDATSIVEVSFNGQTLHDELNPVLPSKALSYDNRSISKIWFRLQTGASAVISIRAWGAR